MMEYLGILAIMAMVVIACLLVFYVFASVMYWAVIVPGEAIKNMFDKNHPDYWRRI